MNNIRLLLLKARWVLLLVGLSGLLLVTFRHPALGFKSFNEAETVIDLQVCEGRQVFDYKGSSLRGAVKAAVFYGEKEGSRGHYEDLWFAGENAIGLKRLLPLSIPSGASVTIAVSCEDPGSLAQVQAAANASLRILLDLYVEGHSLSRLEVRDDDFARALVTQLGRAGFVECSDVVPDEMIESCLSVTIKSVSSGRLYSLNQGVSQ